MSGAIVESEVALSDSFLHQEVKQNAPKPQQPTIVTLNGTHQNAKEDEIDPFDSSVEDESPMEEPIKVQLDKKPSPPTFSIIELLQQFSQLDSFQTHLLSLLVDVQSYFDTKEKTTTTTQQTSTSSSTTSADISLITKFLLFIPQWMEQIETINDYPLHQHVFIFQFLPQLCKFIFSQDTLLPHWTTLQLLIDKSIVPFYLKQLQSLDLQNDDKDYLKDQAKPDLDIILDLFRDLFDSRFNILLKPTTTSQLALWPSVISKKQLQQQETDLSKSFFGWTSEECKQRNFLLPISSKHISKHFSSLALELVNIFCQNYGVHSLVLWFEKSLSKQSSLILFDECTINLIILLLQLCQHGLHIQYIGSIASRCKQIVHTFFHEASVIDDEMIKSKPLRLFYDLLLCTSQLVKKSGSNTAEVSSELLETCKLELAFKYFTSQLLEKRIIGLQEMKLLFKETVDYEYSKKHSKPLQTFVTQLFTNNSTTTAPSLQNSQSFKFLTMKWLQKWLEEKKFFDILFFNNVHSEVMKQSKLLFLCLHRNFSQGLPSSYIDPIWRVIASTEMRHETTQQSILDLFLQLIPNLEPKSQGSQQFSNLIHHFFAQFNSHVSISNLNSIVLDFMKQFTKEAIIYHQIYKISTSEISSYFYLVFFWNAVHDNEWFPTKYHSKAMDCFVELLLLLQKQNDSTIVQFYLQQCLENLKINYSVVTSLQILQHLFLQSTPKIQQQIITIFMDCSMKQVIIQQQQQQQSSTTAQQKNYLIEQLLSIQSVNLQRTQSSRFEISKQIQQRFEFFAAIQGWKWILQQTNPQEWFTILFDQFYYHQNNPIVAAEFIKWIQQQLSSLQELQHHLQSLILHLSFVKRIATVEALELFIQTVVLLQQSTIKISNATPYQIWMECISYVLFSCSLLEEYPQYKEQLQQVLLFSSANYHLTNHIAYEMCLQMMRDFKNDQKVMQRCLEFLYLYLQYYVYCLPNNNELYGVTVLPNSLVQIYYNVQKDEEQLVLEKRIPYVMNWKQLLSILVLPQAIQHCFVFHKNTNQLLQIPLIQSLREEDPVLSSQEPSSVAQEFVIVPLEWKDCISILLHKAIPSFPSHRFSSENMKLHTIEDIPALPHTNECFDLIFTNGLTNLSMQQLSYDILHFLPNYVENDSAINWSTSSLGQVLYRLRSKSQDQVEMIWKQSRDEWMQCLHNILSSNAIEWVHLEFVILTWNMILSGELHDQATHMEEYITFVKRCMDWKSISPLIQQHSQQERLFIWKDLYSKTGDAIVNKKEHILDALFCTLHQLLLSIQSSTMEPIYLSWIDLLCTVLLQCDFELLNQKIVEYASQVLAKLNMSFQLWTQMLQTGLLDSTSTVLTKEYMKLMMIWLKQIQQIEGTSFIEKNRDSLNLIMTSITNRFVPLDASISTVLDSKEAITLTMVVELMEQLDATHAIHSQLEWLQFVFYQLYLSNSNNSSNTSLQHYLSTHAMQNQAFITSILYPLIQSTVSVSSTVYMGWDNYFYNGTTQQKSMQPFVGLKNLGATCYINSLLQQLYSVNPFRSFVLSNSLINPIENANHNQNIPLVNELIKLYLQMQMGIKSYLDTREFCKYCKDMDGNTIQVHVQQDANEFLNLFLDQLEYCCKDVCKLCFGGSTCSVIEYEDKWLSVREEPFYTLGLEIQRKSNLQESLELFCHGEVLAGDNMYYSDVLQKKVEAVKRNLLHQLPNILICHLKRFDYDFHAMRNVKITDKYEFPLSFTIEPQWTSQYHQQLQQQEQDAIAPQEKEEYECIGILIHMGMTADSGHYYSIVKNHTTNQWYEVNDTHVSIFDMSPQNLAKYCYGGKDKSQHAYMLFYKKKTFDMNSVTYSVHPQHVTWMQQEHVKYLQECYVQDVPLQQLLWNQCLHTNNSIEWWQCIFYYVMHVICKQQQGKESVTLKWFQLLQNQMECNKEFQQWVIKTWLHSSSQQDFYIKSILFKCPHSNLRQEFVTCLLQPCLLHSESLLQSLQMYWNDIRLFHYYYTCTEFVQCFVWFAEQKMNHRLQLIHQKTISQLLTCLQDYFKYTSSTFTNSILLSSKQSTHCAVEMLHCLSILVRSCETNQSKSLLPKKSPWSLVQHEEADIEVIELPNKDRDTLFHRPFFLQCFESGYNTQALIEIMLYWSFESIVIASNFGQLVIEQIKDKSSFPTPLTSQSTAVEQLGSSGYAIYFQALEEMLQMEDSCKTKRCEELCSRLWKHLQQETIQTKPALLLLCLKFLIQMANQEPHCKQFVKSVAKEVEEYCTVNQWTIKNLELLME